MNGTILDEIAAAARERVARAKAVRPFESVMSEALASNRNKLSLGVGSFQFGLELKAGRFEHALNSAKNRDGLAFICECKKASPSKGLIAPDFPYMQTAMDYEAAGAAAVSVLTEPQWFLGSGEYLRDIAANVKIPCLRKDFIVDEYMIAEAKTLGAAAVLLIVSLLDGGTLERFIKLCGELDMAALVEAHDEAEIKTALDAGARIIGVNNRNLKDFSVDAGNSGRLRKFVPDDVLFVAESGIKTPEDAAALRDAGADAVLIGEALMTAPDKKEALNKFLKKLKEAGRR